MIVALALGSIGPAEAARAKAHPAFGLPKQFDDPLREIDWAGVYRLAPDGHVLYVANSDPTRAIWMACPLARDGSLGAGRLLYDATPLVGEADPGLPDGLKLDREGNLFATGPGGVLVISADGTLLGRILLGEPTANLAFGEEGHTLFLTSNHDLLRLEVAATGAGF